MTSQDVFSKAHEWELAKAHGENFTMQQIRGLKRLGVELQAAEQKLSVKQQQVEFYINAVLR